MADESLDQGGVLAVSVSEQHAAEAGVVEAREQGRFLAEIARQGDDLHIEAVGKSAGERGRGIAAAVVDVDYLAGERPGPAASLRATSTRRACKAERLSASLNSGTTTERPALEPVEMPRPPVRNGRVGRHRIAFRGTAEPFRSVGQAWDLARAL